MAIRIEKDGSMTVGCLEDIKETKVTEEPVKEEKPKRRTTKSK